jgi:pimeloyl-ACP methyl ester carboxylesterase
MFGMLHRPANTGRGASPLAVLLCPPMGHEAEFSRRTLLKLAEALSQAGIPCLRIDPPGQGDSADPDGVDGQSDGGQGLSHWPDGLVKASEWLLQVTGATQVALVGMRLGATLCASLALRNSEHASLAGRIAGLAVIAPILNGRSLMRQVKTLSLNTMSQAWPNAKAQEGFIEGAGYPLSAADQSFLSGLDLLSLCASPGRAALPRVLLVERDDLPADTKWIQHLQAQGLAVDRCRPEGYQAMMQPSHLSTVPQGLVDEVATWLDGLAVASASPQDRSLPPLADHATKTSAHHGVRETLLWLGPESPQLSGVLVQGARLSSGQVGVLMINTGAESRIGPNRMYVRWARHWATQGWQCLRLDMPGLGNSQPLEGVPSGRSYIQKASDHLRRGIECLQQQGATQFHVIGLCSGAFHGLAAAFEGQPLRSVTAINPMFYFWDEEAMLLSETSEAVVVHISEGIKHSLRDPQRWLKLIRGEIHVGIILSALARRSMQYLRDGARQIARWLHWPLVDDLHMALINAAHHGVKIHMVFSAREPGLPMLLAQAGRAVRQLQSQQALTLTILDRADHTFTHSAARQRLFEVVDQTLRAASQNAPHVLNNMPRAVAGLAQEGN